jgi:type VI secretion system Hcp family effector
MVARSAKVGAVAGLMAMVLWAQPSWGADRAFAIITGLKLGVIQGDSTFSLAPKSIEVLNTGFGLAVAPGGFSKPVAGPLTMLKRFDRATPKLLQAAFVGDRLTVEINWFMDQTGNKTVSIKLEGASITNIDAAAQLDGSTAAGFETVSLFYEKITFTSPIFDSTGKVSGISQVCLDILNNRVC